MTKREFMEQAAIRSLGACQTDRVVEAAAKVWAELDEHFLSSPLGLCPGKELGGENIHKICQFLDALPAGTQQTFLTLMHERYGAKLYR